MGGAGTLLLTAAFLDRAGRSRLMMFAIRQLIHSCLELLQLIVVQSLPEWLCAYDIMTSCSMTVGLFGCCRLQVAACPPAHARFLTSMALWSGC